MLLGSIALLAGCDRKAEATFHGVKLTGASYARDFRLKDVQGRERTLADFRGKAVLLHFGFTMCADVCPTALARAARVKTRLGGLGNRLQVLFVTLDPQRDTPQIESDYTATFDPSFLGLYGNEEQTRAVADQFKVFYRKVPMGDTYTIDHSALAYAFDPEGRIRVALRHDQSDDDCAHDLRQLFS
jgi:protein SCO1/2